MPWIILTVFVLLWGLQDVEAAINGIWTQSVPSEGLHRMEVKVPPMVERPAPEAAVYAFNILSMTRTGILLAAGVGGAAVGFEPVALLRQYGETLWVARYSLLTFAAMLGLGHLTRYSGPDASMGLAFATTGGVPPLLRHPARRGADRLRHGVQRVVRRLAEDRGEQIGLPPR